MLHNVLSRVQTYNKSATKRRRSIVFIFLNCCFDYYWSETFALMLHAKLISFHCWIALSCANMHTQHTLKVNYLSLLHHSLSLLLCVQVKVWFQNRRTKYKRQKLEEEGPDSQQKKKGNHHINRWRIATKQASSEDIDVTSEDWERKTKEKPLSDSLTSAASASDAPRGPTTLFIM